MKRLHITIIFAAICSWVAAQAPVLSFEKKTHDFGTIEEVNGKATTVFTFENTGATPLVITRVTASCGCTAPSWNKEPILPGKTGTVTVTYNPFARPGRFAKSIMVYSNATEAQVRLIIKGDVIPKPVDLKAKFSVKVSEDIRLESSSVQFNTVQKGQTGYRILEIMNFGQQKRKVTFENPHKFILLNTQATEIEPGKTFKLHVRFASEACEDWGPNNYKIKVNAPDGDAYELKLQVNISENFQQMSREERVKAPIVEWNTKILDAGTVRAGSTKKMQLTISNKGISDLIVRRIINNNPEIKVIANKETIEQGKKGTLSIELKPNNLRSGNYRRSFSLQTNDPEQPYSVISIAWKIDE